MTNAVLSFVLFTLSATIQAQVAPNAKAPEFEISTQDGKIVKLSDFQGKHVVLEWFNDECPYVVKHYSSSNMQNLQKEFKDKGVVWLTVSSSAPDKQGHLDANAAKMMMTKHKMGAEAILLDHDGKVGQAYGAKTTPHMYVINPKGLLVYQGAIDDNPSSDPKTIATAKPLFKDALNASLENKKMTNASTKPYGCSVKY